MPIVGNTNNSIACWNNTGVAMALNVLVSISGFNTSNSMPTMQLAVANGTNARADGILAQAVGISGAGYIYPYNYLLEAQNTSGRTIGDPVYLSPTTPGGYTFTRPSTAGQDIQEIGVVLTVSATIGRILITCTSGEVGQGPNAITDILLSSKMYRDIGQAGFGYIRFTGATTDGDRISIAGRIYEFDTAADPGAIGAGANVRVNTSGGASAAQSVTALVAAINADASRTVNAADIGGNIVGLCSLAALDGSNFAYADTIDAGAVIVPGAATATGAATAATQMRLARRYTLVAADVTALAASLGTNEIVIGVFASTTTPTLRFAQGWSAAGSPISLDGATFVLRSANGAFALLCYAEPAGGALLIAGDSISFELSAAG